MALQRLANIVIHGQLDRAGQRPLERIVLEIKENVSIREYTKSKALRPCAPGD